MPSTAPCLPADGQTRVSQTRLPEGEGTGLGGDTGPSCSLDNTHSLGPHTVCGT